MLNGFFDKFKRECRKAEKEEAKDFGLTCPRCNERLYVRHGKFGFYALCIDDFCGYHTSIDWVEGKPIPRDDRNPDFISGLECPICKSEMFRRDGRYGPFICCKNYPECKGTRKLPSGKMCPICGKDLWQTTYFGKNVLFCTGYPNCTHSEEIDPKACGNWVDPNSLRIELYRKPIRQILGNKSSDSRRKNKKSKLTALTNKAQEVNLKDSEFQYEADEHLSKTRLSSLIQNKQVKTTLERPTANLIDLMHWVKSEFSQHLKGGDFECFIHNKIVIDGTFLKFCEENNVKVECLLKDSIASWKSEHDYEHFMAQGVFKISYEKLDFLHCALFHKGNQNEDEVSFFVVVSNNNFEQYVNLRNKFEKWLISRDRDQKEIHVVGGPSIPYDVNLKWEDIFLPDLLKNEIKNSVEGWLKAKDFYLNKNLPWKRGILLWGLPGNGKTSLIRTIISNYDFKPVTVQSGAHTNDDTVTEAFEYAQAQSPALLYFEDLDNMFQTVSLSHFLNLMDGVNSKNGILVIATANNISRLQQSVTDRPSRFDRKWEIPLPDKKMSIKYLEKWFGKLLSAKEYKKIVDFTVENNFSYAYLKELYLTSMLNAIASNKDKPSVEDIYNATNQMISDKEVAESGFDLNSGKEIGIEAMYEEFEDE
jgi:ATP-dependent 26S proteasome regulatory subunit